MINKQQTKELKEDKVKVLTEELITNKHLINPPPLSYEEYLSLLLARTGII